MITKHNWPRRVDLAFFLKRGVQLLKGGGVYDFFVFDGGDYVAELVDAPSEILKILIANGPF